MPPPRSNSNLMTVVLPDLSLGLVSDVHPMAIPPGGASEMSNMVWVDGYLRPRPGLDEVFVQAGGQVIQSLVRQSDGVILMTTVVAGAQRYYAGGGVWIELFDSGGVSPPAVVAATTENPTAATFKGQTYFASGLDRLVYYSPATGQVEFLANSPAATNLDPPGNPKIVVSNGTRLFLANVNEDYQRTSTRVPYRVAWSDFLNDLGWNGGVGAGSSGFQDLARTADPVTGLYVGSSVILAFKPTEIWLGLFVDFPKVYEFRPFISGIGCVSHHTICEYQSGRIVWLGDDNVYLGVPGQVPEAIGDRIRVRLRAITQLSGLEKSRAMIDRENHLYILFLPGVSGGNTNHAILVCNLRNLSWWEWSLGNTASHAPTCLLDYRADPWDTTMILGCLDGKLRAMDFSYTDDDGTAFASSWTSGVLSVAEITKRQHEQASVQVMRAFGESGTVALSLLAGNGLGAFSTVSMGTQTFGASQALRVVRRVNSAEHFKLRVSHTTAVGAAKVAAVGVGAVLEGGTQHFA